MRLDPVATFGEGAGVMDKATPRRPRRILWQNVLTVFSAAILISA